eukprot:CAMPEP_0194447910 /NCGR_PEP_ID=MMETSP0176-20130528/129275_1 /TAXON_ID=216777 /ORGANISM="Proboscia alata, Strain PI-D3" /LENGTH=328 /DNA_ID=CAMNT_0039274821 /DNA_START=42 /DNA_END=1025 /DNA_ORIENTATION=+
MTEETSTQDDESYTDISELLRIFDSHSIKSGGLSQVSEKNDTERIQSELSSWFDKNTPSMLKDSSSPKNCSRQSQLPLPDDESSSGATETSLGDLKNKELEDEFSTLDKGFRALNKWQSKAEEKYLVRKMSAELQSLNSQEIPDEAKKQPDLSKGAPTTAALNKWKSFAGQEQIESEKSENIEVLDSDEVLSDKESSAESAEASLGFKGDDSLGDDFFDDESSSGATETSFGDLKNKELEDEFSTLDKGFRALNKWQSKAEEKYLVRKMSAELQSLNSQEIPDEAKKQPDLSKGAPTTAALNKWKSFAGQEQIESEKSENIEVLDSDE